MINYSESQKSIVLIDFSERKTWGEHGDGLLFFCYGSLDAPEIMPNGSYVKGFNNCFYREYC
jgi:hypothetical protein